MQHGAPEGCSFIKAANGRYPVEAGCEPRHDQHSPTVPHGHRKARKTRYRRAEPALFVAEEAAQLRATEEYAEEVEWSRRDIPLAVSLGIELRGPSYGGAKKWVVRARHIPRAGSRRR